MVVDIERTEATVMGHITVTGATTTAFFGWLELIDRLDRAVEGHCGPGLGGSGAEGS